MSRSYVEPQSRFLWLLPMLLVVGFVINVATIKIAPAQGASKPLSANDLSILFPAPQKPADLANLIGVADLAGPTGSPQRLLSDDDFAQFLKNAENPERDPSLDSAAPNTTARKMVLPESVRNIKVWFVAGIRIDAGAPGLSNEIIEQFGRQPQIRLIVQPVTNGPDGFKVHDVAGHLIFSFALNDTDPAPDGCLPFARSKPDDEAFKSVIRDVATLRDQLAVGKFGGTKVVTTGDLNVHPGLRGASARPFRDALKALLEKHLAPSRLKTMAIMGTQPPEPWIFVSMLRHPQLGLITVQGPALDGVRVAQMFSVLGDKHVVPQPAPNNKNPITCRHAALQQPPLPVRDRLGVSTSDFIDGNISDSDILDRLNIIADPKKSHFFNTDCVSCHTETAQPLARNIKNFKVPGVSTAVLPKETWNVRNFGWFPSFLHGGVAPTITRRAAAETADVVSFVNSQLLNK